MHATKEAGLKISIGITVCGIIYCNLSVVISPNLLHCRSDAISIFNKIQTPLNVRHFSGSH